VFLFLNCDKQRFMASSPSKFCSLFWHRILHVTFSVYCSPYLQPEFWINILAFYNFDYAQRFLFSFWNFHKNLYLHYYIKQDLHYLLIASSVEISYISRSDENSIKNSFQLKYNYQYFFTITGSKSGLEKQGSCIESRVRPHSAIYCSCRKWSPHTV
jgi:hypothetical protein